jgi:hypothetical protein
MKMQTLFGGILLAIGILIAGASGLCTIVFVGSMIVDATHGPGGTGAVGNLLGVATIVGGIPFAIGLGLIFAGLSLIRGERDT